MNVHGNSGVVYLVDDDPAVLSFLQGLLATIGAQVKAFESAADFLATYHPTPCECLICDLRMPEMDGVELQRRLQDIHATIPIIFLTGYAEVDVAVEAMRQGALDFLQKPFSAHVLLAKVRTGLEMSRVHHEQWLKDETKRARESLLTQQELKIVRLVVDAKSSREISELLNISVRTVEKHRTRIMEKLHTESTVELVKLFI